MNAYFRHTAAALALIAGTSSAGAQWVYEAPVASRPAVTQPLALTAQQRTIIYRTIIPQGRNRQPIVREQIVTEPVAPAPVVRERVVTTAPLDSDYYAYSYAPGAGARVVVREPDAYGSYAYVGTRVAPSASLAPLPPAAIAAVPSAQAYRYMVINNRLLLVDPDTGIVVADLTQ